MSVLGSEWSRKGVVKDIAKHNLGKRRAPYCDRRGRGLSEEEGLGVLLYGMLCGINRMWTTDYGNHGLLGILLRSFEKREQERITTQHASIFSLLSMYECFPQIYTCTPHVCSVPVGARVEGWIGSLGTRVKNGCELPCGCQELNPGPQQE